MEKMSQSLQKELENSRAIIHAHPVSEAFEVLASDWLKYYWANEKPGASGIVLTLPVMVSPANFLV